jgi:hypothetical protein
MLYGNCAALAQTLNAFNFFFCRQTQRRCFGRWIRGYSELHKQYRLFMLRQLVSRIDVGSDERAAELGTVLETVAVGDPSHGTRDTTTIDSSFRRASFTKESGCDAVNNDISRMTMRGSAKSSQMDAFPTSYHEVVH